MMNMYYGDELAYEVLYDKIFIGAWIILERHFPLVCNCSYCQHRRIEKQTLRLWLPEDRSCHSWRVLCWTKGDAYYFLRSTLPKLSWFGRFDRWYNGWRFISMPFGKNDVTHALLSIAKNSPYKCKDKYIESIFWFNMT